MVNGSMALSCPKLDAELARARQRERLGGKIAFLAEEVGKAEQRVQEQRTAARAANDKASGELARIQPGKQANSDAVALSRYLVAVGLCMTPNRLNDLLALLAVLMIETGGGLALSIGMALQVPAGEAAEAPKAASVQTAASMVMPPVDTAVDGQCRPTVQLSRQPAPLVQSPNADADLPRWLRSKGGRVHTSMRRLARELGRSAAGVHIEVGRLAAAGVLTAIPSARGTVLTLIDAGRLN